MHSCKKILRRTAQTMPPVRRCTSSLASPSRKVSGFPSLSSAADKQKRTTKTMRSERSEEKKRVRLQLLRAKWQLESRSHLQHYRFKRPRRLTSVSYFHESNLLVLLRPILHFSCLLSAFSWCEVKKVNIINVTQKKQYGAQQHSKNDIAQE